MVLNAKGDLSKSLDEMKASSKFETTVPTDYYGFIYQMKTYSALVEIITGKCSLISVQLENLVRLIKKYASCYKLEIAQDKCFPGKFENVVDSRFHLFLQDCRKSLDREDVNNHLVDFRDLHKDVLLHKFNVQSLPACFSLVDDSKISAGGDTKLSDATNPGGNNNKKEGSKRKSGNEDNENKGNKKRFGVVENKDQVPEFKMMEGEKWGKFQGKCTES
jgi:hypothetical protein